MAENIESSGSLDSSRLRSLLRMLPRIQVSFHEYETFTIFPRLPIELRAKIWRAAAFTPTTSGFSCERKHRTDDLVLHGHEFIPAFLSTSKEARDEGYKHYQVCYLKSMVWHPELRRQVGRKRKVCFNFQVHEFTASTKIIPELTLYDQILDLSSADMKKAEILTFRNDGIEPDRSVGLYLSAEWTDFLNVFFPNLKYVSILVEEWGCGDGVNQGVGQDLWRAELHDKFHKHYEEVLKEVKSKPKLRILFKDDYDSDATPISVDFKPGADGYFSRAEPTEHEDS